MLGYIEVEVPDVNKRDMEIFVRHNIAPQFYKFILNHCSREDLDNVCKEFSAAQSKFVEVFFERYDFDGHLMGR